MGERQNESGALRLLVAQRRVYSVAKRWQAARTIGVVGLGLVAPIVVILWPGTAAIVGACAGAWLFLSRTLFTYVANRLMERAAATQDEFDRRIFGMEARPRRSAALTPEDLARAGGDDDEVRRRARAGKLLDWYVFPAAATPRQAVASAQRANLSYSKRLIDVAGVLAISITVGWVSLAAVISLVMGLDLATFLLGVAFPLLPALLDAAQHSYELRRSGRERAELAEVIEAAIPLEPDEGMIHEWQERIFELRRTSPWVPDWLYWRLRSRNENAMKIVASRAVEPPQSER